MACKLVLVLLILALSSRSNAQTQLVTLTRDDMLNIVHCISQSKDQTLQRKFVDCENMMPTQVQTSLSVCRDEIIGKNVPNYYDVMAKNPEAIDKMFECIRKRTTSYTKEEKAQMVTFENCSRKLQRESCSTRHHNH